MSLNDRQHVEAVAIIRALVQVTPTELKGDAYGAAVQWLEENHPSPAAYMNALRDRAVAHHPGHEEGAI